MFMSPRQSDSANVDMQASTSTRRGCFHGRLLMSLTHAMQAVISSAVSQAHLCSDFLCSSPDLHLELVE